MSNIGLESRRFSALEVVERATEDDKPEWELLAELSFASGDGTTYVAPAGMRTNFASVPFFLTWVVPRSGRHNKAAVIHDLLWREANAGSRDRRVADEVFREALAALDVSWLRRWMMWTAVRQAGFFGKTRGSWPLGDVSRVLLITVLVAPIVIPVSSVVVGGRAALWLIDLVPAMLRHKEMPVTDEL